MRPAASRDAGGIVVIEASYSSGRIERATNFAMPLTKGSTPMKPVPGSPPDPQPSISLRLRRADLQAKASTCGVEQRAKILRRRLAEIEEQARERLVDARRWAGRTVLPRRRTEEGLGRPAASRLGGHHPPLRPSGPSQGPCALQENEPSRPGLRPKCP